MSGGPNLLVAKYKQDPYRAYHKVVILNNGRDYGEIMPGTGTGYFLHKITGNPEENPE